MNKTNPIDAYLAGVSNPEAKKTLTALRTQLRKLLPGATETISYGMPAFRLESGKVAAGFAFSGKNCGYYPHSGNVVAALGPMLDGYKTSSGAVSFPPDRPLPAKIVKALVKARLDELAKANAITERVSDDAVKEATGRDWKGWFRVLDRAGAKNLSHKEIVAQLEEEGASSGWWRQSISVAYEHARGMRVVGQTADTGFQIGVQKTLNMTADEVWELLAHAPEAVARRGRAVRAGEGRGVGAARAARVTSSRRRGSSGGAREAGADDVAPGGMEEACAAPAHRDADAEEHLAPRAHGEAPGCEGARGDAGALARDPREVGSAGRVIARYDSRMALQEDFQSAQQQVKTLSARPSNDTLLELYSLFKQATDGDVQGKRPGMLDLKGRAKYDAWAGRKGMSREDAMQRYVALVNRLLAGG